MAIGSLDNAWIAFRATSDNTFTRTAPEGTSLDFCLGWVSVYAQTLPVGLDPATFLFQSLYLVHLIIDKCHFLSRLCPRFSLMVIQKVSKARVRQAGGFYSGGGYELVYGYNLSNERPPTTSYPYWYLPSPLFVLSMQ